MADESVKSKYNTDKNFEAQAVNHTRFFSHSTRFFHHHIPTEFLLLGVIEFFALILSFYGTLELRMGWGWFDNELAVLPRAILFAVIMQIGLIAFGSYQRQANTTSNILAVRIGASVLLGGIILSVIYYVFPLFLTGRGTLAQALLVCFVILMAIRLLFRKFSSTYDIRLRVLVLGAGKVANLVREAEAQGEIEGINVISYMQMPGDKNNERGIGMAQTPGALVKFVAAERIDVILLAMDERRNGLPVHDLLDCKMSGIEVIDLLTFFERYTNKVRLDIVQPSWLFLSDGFQVNNLKRIGKWAFDISAVMLLLPIVLPVALLASLAILVESGFKGPVLYSQVRVGKNGRLFRVYKFRSMVVNAEQDGVARWAEKGDSRITRVGNFLRKTRLDELPQLFNILKGDMSFVGPRPERPEFVKHLAEKIPYYNERHRVKPGLSGWAQIRYPYGASVDDGLEKLQYDLYYVKNYNILLDILVLLQTAEVVLLGRGAH